MRLGGPGRTYYHRRRAAGDTKSEAIRALRRRLSDEVFRRMHLDESRAVASSPLAA
jgi:transposase